MTIHDKLKELHGLFDPTHNSSSLNHYVNDGLYVMGRRTVAALEIAIKALEQSTEALAHCYDVVEWPGEGVDSPQWLALKANKHALAEIEKTLQ